MIKSSSLALVVALISALLLYQILDLHTSRESNTARSNQPLPNNDLQPPPSAFVMLIRNRLQDAVEALTVISSIERQFNHKHKYPFVVFHEGLPEKGRQLMKNAASSEMSFVIVNFTTPTVLKSTGKPPPETVAGFGDKSYIGYRHMCRFFAGQITTHPALQKYRYIWRLDADAEYICPIERDPFKVMHQNNKKYGYAIGLSELQFRSSHTLYQTVLGYLSTLQPTTASIYRNRLRWRTNAWGDYNRCHYWNNLELMDLDFFRSADWQSYFNYLDEAEGIWTERWGDALIRTLGVDMMLEPRDIEQFHDIGYKHHDLCINPCNAAVSCNRQAGNVDNIGWCWSPVAFYRPDALIMILWVDYPFISAVLLSISVLMAFNLIQRRNYLNLCFNRCCKESSTLRARD